MALLLVVGILGGFLSAAPEMPRSGILDLGYSRYQGLSLYNGVDEFLGMRYAKPPVKDLRWRAPQDPEETGNETINATKFAPICVGVNQRPSNSLAEDCLYINVWRPSVLASDTKLPVWVFIQGGGYASLSNANYNGSKVVEESGHEIVFVNFNYRVGALGFLASEEIDRDGDLNVGLLDQRKALQWVQDHIRVFGGDPDHVVIHGDSAGAGSVAHHLTATDANERHFFVGAVAESNFWPTQRTVTEMKFQYDGFVKDLGCDGKDNSLSCLRSLRIDTLQKADVTKPFPGGSKSPNPLWYFLPVVDGKLVPDRLWHLFQQDKFLHVPLMVSDDTNEGTDFGYNADNPQEVAQFIKNNYPGLNDTQLSTINRAYPLTQPLPKHKPYFPSAAKAYGESTFTCPGNLMSASMAQHFSADKVWNYRFNVRDPSEVAAGKGVPHVFDLPAIFGVSSTNEPTESYATINRAIIPITMNYFLSFVKSLDPNKHRDKKAPEWKSWGKGTGQRLKLQTNATEMEDVPKDQLERCSMWNTLAAAMQH
ncbi:hypothetical protein N7492_009880 [Penicillium capsulatum]|uniref:Carboxylic ester hydrolase n=1 Tax=Penicillium capsulatum TaxID=69766 RepID=A0A9W9HMY6_9EURO|nr:hypothetical protein N7492_009880 [Penicillium capsulatum]KAJ6112391.1 hypothetical protein N7512_007715 [Penicillium capsulatum]